MPETDFQGAVITPYYDSLLVKVSTHALTFEQAAAKMVRNLKEFRIRGIKTNIPFLINVMKHEEFISGNYHTAFLDESPELFKFPVSKDRGTKMLSYIANVTINGFPGVEKKKNRYFPDPRVPIISDNEATLTGTKQILDTQGADGLVKWIKNQKQDLITDTTFRDAHQSLLATRLRTHDMMKIA